MTRFLITICALFYSGILMAATAIVQNASGDVKAASGSDAAFVVTRNSTLENGMTVMTGDNSHTVIKFEDGQMVALNSNTSFKINQYHFEQAKPEKNSIVFSLLKGAMRALSGLIVKNNPDVFALHTPAATIGIRGTDFMAATGSLYLKVIHGMVSTTTSVGTATFAAGQTGFVASQSALPTAISATQLPPAVASSFFQLGSIDMTGAGAIRGSSAGDATGRTAGAGDDVGSTAATDAAVGPLSTAVVVGTLGVIAAVAVIASGNNATTVTATVAQ